MVAFGRLYSPDERDRNFPLRALVAPTLLPWKRWAPGKQLDQNGHGKCVGAGWEGFLRASPVRHAPLNMDQIYCEAVGVDEWAENDHDCQAMQFGTSVRAGAQVLRAHGLIEGGFHWADDAQDIIDFLRSPDGGPVVTGFMWKAGMMVPDKRGFGHYTGQDVGGHCTLYYHVNTNHGFVTGQNSWWDEENQRWWGVNGRFRTGFDDLGKLLQDQGEACAARQVGQGL